MKLLSVIPTIFYSDIQVGLRLFMDGLGFTILYENEGPEKNFYIIEKDASVIHLVQNKISAEKDRPEIRIHTDDIDAVYKNVVEKHPEFLHPNLKEIKEQPWGLREFALLDSSGVCVIIQQ